jgi:hypothetical protein
MEKSRSNSAEHQLVILDLEGPHGVLILGFFRGFLFFWSAPS